MLTKGQKVMLNNQKVKAEEMRKQCEALGLPHIGVEFTNITFACEKIIKHNQRKAANDKSTD